MGLITLNEYHTYTNSTNSTSDTLVVTLIESVSDQIENYCDRVFAAADYSEWVSIRSCHPSYRPRQYPVNRVKMVGQANTALELTNNSATSSYTITVTSENMYINDEDLAENSYDLTNASYDTLGELETAVEADTDILITVKDDVSQLSKLLDDKTQTLDESGSLTWDGVEVGGSVRVDNNTFWFGCGGRYYIRYNAGYSTIPTDLQNATAQMVKDALAVGEDTVNKNLKSESITNYSYTLMDNVDYNNLIEAHKGVLNIYRRVHI